MAADCRWELKPCPFCGSTEIVLSNWGMFRCWCTKCRAKTDDMLLEIDAVLAWNRRANDGE